MKRTPAGIDPSHSGDEELVRVAGVGHWITERAHDLVWTDFAPFLNE